MQERSVNRGLRWAVGALLVLAVLAGITSLAGARTRSTISITINNNSNQEIRHLYLAAAGDPNNWGPDQLGESRISPGGSFTVNNVSCDAASVRVIAEDQNGCFLYNNVSCGDNPAWTITDSATSDCGN